jgi:hypothetical protein
LVLYTARPEDALRETAAAVPVKYGQTLLGRLFLFTGYSIKFSIVIDVKSIYLVDVPVGVLRNYSGLRHVLLQAILVM